MLALSRDMSTMFYLLCIYSSSPQKSANVLGKETTSATLLDTQGTINLRYRVGFPSFASLIISFLVRTHKVFATGGARQLSQILRLLKSPLVKNGPKLFWIHWNFP